MNYKLLLTLFLIGSLCTVNAQEEVKPRPITLDEYKKAKGFVVNDLDKDTYIKFDNTYVLDRYEMRKPYFVTGDDGLKKRFDLYKLLAKTGMEELGLMIFYTNENAKVYKAVLPNFTADAKVWEQYFEDIHAIDKEEKNFVLKLSYILSKELGFQFYKSINKDKDISKESATYGNDICFPGDQLITLSNGGHKFLKDVVPGDEVQTTNTSNKRKSIVVKELAVHDAKNYALTKITLINSEYTSSNEIVLHTKTLEATPNHPMKTSTGTKPIGKVKPGETILCQNEITNDIDTFEVMDVVEYKGASQKVYNIVGDEEDSFLMNGVMVLQK